MMETQDEIAIVGIGCNFPGGEGIDNFWQVLIEGKNYVQEIPLERFDTRDWYDPDNSKPGKTSTRHAALIEEFNAFDNRLFGINDVEAGCMDPQQKLLLECTYRALEDAGVTREDINGSKTGVFIGMMNRDYLLRSIRSTSEISHYDATGAAMSIAANRISYTFNLTGPSIAIDTACSSFHYALHFALQAIKQGDCEAALCGAVNCIIEPRVFIPLSKAKLISPEGVSKPFSTKGDGYGRGEGCGVLLLKPLKKAQQDFSKIWGVISMSTINHNGRSVTPITRPSQQQQENLLLSIYPAHVNPSMIQYIEAHGTGTPAGDPVEAESIGNVIGKMRAANLPLLKIGSVKGNIGHTESAAGAAGLIKVLLMMHHGKIVPSLHFSESNSSINTKKLNLSVPTTVEKWDEPSESGRIAGVNSFGVGGTNAHVVVRQFKQTQVLPSVKRPVELIPISAASGNSLKLTMEDTARYLKTSDSVALSNLAYTSACRRSHVNYKYRKAFVVSSLQQLEQELCSGAEIETVPAKKPLQLIFVFSGNGLNLKGVSETLLKSEPVFSDKYNEIQAMFQKYSTFDIFRLTESDQEDLSKPDIAQPLIFTLQVALFTLLQYWGIRPIAAVGHSVGEVAAAHCAGLISLEDAVKVIHHRSRLQAKVTGGRMLVVGNVPVQEVSTALGAYSGKVCVAAFNSPQSCTLSGDADAIDGLQKHLAEHFNRRNIFLQALNVPVAYHSHMMDTILTELAASLPELKKGKAEIDLISTTTGKTVSDDDFVTGKYWAKQAREPVCFTEAIMALAKDKDNIAFVEIGPQRALQRYIQEILGIQTKVFPSLQIFKEHETLLNLVKGLFELGLNPNWEHIFEGYQGIPAPYPRYQFDHKKLLSFNNMVRQTTATAANLNHLLIHNVSNDNTEFRCSVSQALTPYLYEHKHNGIALVPGAFFVELALAAVLTVSRPKVPANLYQLSIKFTSPCVLNEGFLDLKVKLDSQKEGRDFKILSSSSDAVFALGRIKQNPEVCLEEKSISYKDIFQRCKTFVSKDEIYETLYHSGFHYGSVLKQLSDVFYSEELKEAITIIKVNKQTREEMHEYFIHPVLLDCFLHMTGLLTLKTCKNVIGFPSNINSFVIVRPLEEEMMIYLKVNKSAENYFEFCGCFTDKHGFVLAEMKRVGITVIKETFRNENNLLFENKWKETEHSPVIQTSGEALRFTVFADKIGVHQQLKKYLHKNSNFLMYEEWDKLLECQSSESPSWDRVKLEVQEYSDVLFMWGIQRLNERNPDTIVASLSKCCEAFRQLIIALKEKNNSQSSVKIITYRTVDNNVDHINPGFALYGMARCCMLETTGITFQMIDISSTSTVDILALVDVLGGYKAELYPEVWINQGNIYTSEIRRTQVKDTIYNNPSQSIHHNSELEPFSLYTCEPNEARDIFAELADDTNFPLDNHSVELKIEKINIHTEDYYPVSACSSNFGKTLYWNSQTVDKYKLLALDYSGTVVATGTEVKKLKVGDHVVSCYPVAASSKVIIPETVCFNTRKFQCFEMVPCMSFFRIAWEIVHLMLPKSKQNGSLGIISTEPESVLCKVLTHSAQEAGWKIVCTILDSSLEEHVAHCNALVFLPPLERLPKDILLHLSHLQDVVVIQDNCHSECLRSLIGSDHESFKINVLSLATIFQKASLKHSQKAFSNWLKSIQLKQFKNMPCSIFQHAENSERTDTATSSTFACKSVSLAVLKGDAHKTCISDIPMYESKRKMFKQNAVYIVTGGLTGLGFETVRFIAQNGGGCIVILSRRKPSLEKQKEISNLQNQNEWSRIVSLQCNVIFKPEVERAMSSIRKIFPNCPIKGIFHSAMVLHDGVMEALNVSAFEKVLSPKVAGAINLHCASQGQELDYFVCYSSVASFLGNSVQANYAAANSFLDLFCHYRRNCGLSAQSINWGALNLGVLQNQSHIQNLLESKGILTLQPNEIYESLKKILILNNPQQAVVKLNFPTFTSYYFLRYPAFKKRMYAIMLELTGNNVELLEQNVAHDLAPKKAEDYVLSLVNQLTGTDSSDIAMNTSLFSVGIDSMLAMTLQHNIFQELKVDVPLVKLLDPETTVQSLTSFVEEALKGDRIAKRE
ncbi:LOW QUALITY PROTEIN: hybrid PKS-NRPS synthetase pynA-like [Sceloporus undulatus]|uniref:LOW QUALITY PROTEIN: hybrid PKS-NRPS synthetase pynA-like n=1 Tax=Sceloporus undulatus TaxID=8520 RepID=UPI001C4CBF04|nr:LOW QUALITY PROTEIN: hybrid PKS-NRPS synthetase pynA-like [Sceloporus undulatus]